MAESPGRDERRARGGGADKPVRRRSVRAQNEAGSASGSDAERVGARKPRRPARGARPGRTAAASADGAPSGADPSDVARQRIKRTSMAAVALMAAIVLISTGIAWGTFYNLGGDIERTGGLTNKRPDGATDILLVGTDARTDAKGNPLTPQELARLNAGVDDGTLNTDTIILIRIPNDGKSATAISIPRDAYVAIPDQGRNKINSAFAGAANVRRDELLAQGVANADAVKAGNEEGRKALIETVADLTGISVDNYAEIGLVGFSRLTDAVGGVEVCLKNRVNDQFSGASFKRGKQLLRGPQALSFVRQRHGLPRGDLDRITRQQVFMASLANKVLSTDTLSNPSKVGQLQNAITTSVTLDANWDVISFAKELANLSAGNVKFSTIPVIRDDGWSDDGTQSVVVVDPKQVQNYVHSLLGDKPGEGESSASSASTTTPAVPAVDRPSVTVDVVNGGSTGGLASSVSLFLTSKGFGSGSTGNAQASENALSSASAVLASSADDQGAKAVAAILGGLPVVVQSSLAAGQVRVLLRDNYTGPGSNENSGDDSTATTTTSSLPPGMTEEIDPSVAAEISSELNRPGYSASQDGGVPCVD